MATKAQIQLLRFHATRGQVEPTVRTTAATVQSVIKQGYLLEATERSNGWGTVTFEGKKVAGIV